ncbi:MAG TPA: NADPH-dependent F420 reductase [Ramlibacter sp.]|nr:NADPH-dependent F420 reductase [Ramlibacter sp.]
MDGGKTIAVLGGTGAEGGGLALRWAQAGHHVVIGSRSADRAATAAAQINDKLGRQQASGADNLAAARAADIVVLAVPYAAQRPTALEIREALAGKILVDVTVPLVPPKVARVQLPAGGSAVAALQAELGEAVQVVSAFQNVSAHHLADLAHAMDCDVLVCGDDEAAREEVIALAAAAGMRGLHAGPLANSAAAEALTSILISINRRYKVDGAGIRITGIA